MTDADVGYVKKVFDAGLIQSPCLEMGVGYEGFNCKALLQSAGMRYFGTDMIPGKDVDYVVDFEKPTESIEKSFVDIGKFGSVIMVAVLEHALEPIKVLDNAFAILRSGGVCIVIAPAVWTIHNYPIDCYRFNPDFFEEYCKRRSLYLLRDYFEYVGFCKIDSMRNKSKTHVLPLPSQDKFKVFVSRIIHRLFDTYGREMFFPCHVGIGAAIKKL